MQDSLPSSSLLIGDSIRIDDLRQKGNDVGATAGLGSAGKTKKKTPSMKKKKKKKKEKKKCTIFAT
jgi:hypothetical protein